MEDHKKIFIVGLPNAGKTSYIAGLYASEKSNNKEHKITCHGLPDEAEYLESIQECWNKTIPVMRSSVPAPAKITIPMIRNSDNMIFDLDIPDFKGEDFKNIICNIIPDKIKKWFDGVIGIIYFINGICKPILKDDTETKNNNEDKKEPETMTVDNIDTLTLNIMLLKYIREKYGDKKIAIVFSAFDKIDTYKSIDEYLDKELPFLKKFVSTHFNKYTFWGVSAQGGEYNNDNSPNLELRTKTKEGIRSYIFTNQKIYDLTIPIDYILSI